MFADLKGKERHSCIGTMAVFKLIKAFIAENPGTIALYLILLMAATVISIVGITRATASMYENASKSNKNSAMKMLSIIIVLTVISQSLTYGVDWIDNRMAPRFRQFATQSVVKEIFSANRMSFLDVIPMRYRAYLKSTAQSTYHIFNTLIKTYTPNIVLALCLLAYLFYLDYRYGLIFLFGGAVITITFFANKNNVMETTKAVEVQSRTADIYTYDVLSCLNTVVSKNTLAQEFDNITGVVQTATEKHIEMNQNFDNLNYMFVGFIIVLAFVVMWLALSKLGKKSKNDNKGAVTAVLTALSLMATLRTKMSSITTANLNVVTEFGRYNANVLESVQSMAKLDGTQILCSPENHGRTEGTACRLFLDFEDVSFAYPGSQRQIIQNFNWSIGPGINVLKAKSGCGKTTLAKIIMRLFDPSSGTIRINGINIQDIQVDSIRKNIVFSNQDMGLFNRTLREICLYGTDATEQELQEVWSMFQDSFRDVSLDDRVGLSGGRMSTGMKQILRIANLLLSQTPCALIDEPCAGLDPKNKKTVLRLIKQLGKKKKTVLLITHDAEVTRYGNNVYYMEPPKNDMQKKVSKASDLVKTETSNDQLDWA